MDAVQVIKPSESDRKLYVVLENASLDVAKIGNDYELLNTDDHQAFLRKRKRDAPEVRPDIVHQCLLSLMDSPLNKAGMLQVYIHTTNNVLIDIHPSTRIPRTFRRFCFLMVHLLQKLSIQAANGSEKLLKVIKNPVMDHLPAGAPRIGMLPHPLRVRDPSCWIAAHD